MGAIEDAVPAWLAAPVGIVILLTAFAAAARKPPLKWVGHWFSWIFRRIIGEPIAEFADQHFRTQVIPIIREEIQPLKDGQTQMALDQAHIHDCIEEVKRGQDDAKAAAILAVEQVRDLRVDTATFQKVLTDQADTIAERGRILEDVAPLIERGKALLDSIKPKET